VPTKKRAVAKNGTSADLGLEQRLWAAADRTRGYGEFRLPREIAASLTHLLLATATKARVESRSVITTSPGLWLPFGAAGNLTIIDVSRLFGSAGWETERDIEDRVVRELVDLGWPEQLIRAGNSRVPDIFLCSTEGVPIAGVEIKRHIDAQTNSAFLALLADRSLAAGIQRLYVTDGWKVTLLDHTNALVVRDESLPRPEQLGVVPTAGPRARNGASLVSVLRPESMPDFIDSIRQDACVIVDHTLPWGDHSSRVRSFVGETCLPTELQRRSVSTLPFVLAVVASTKPRAIVALAFRALLVSEQFAALRSYIASQISVRGVVTLPPGLFAPIGNVATVMLALGDFGGSSDRAVFLEVGKIGEVFDAEQQHWWTLFIDGLSGRDSSNSYSATVSPRSWDPAIYSPNVRHLDDRLAKLGQVSRLEELFDIQAGVGSPGKEVQRGGVKLIRGRDVQAGVSLRYDDLNSYEFLQPHNRSVTVRAGDIVIQRIGTSPSAAVVAEDASGAAASQTVYVLRPKNAATSVAAAVAFLNSSAAHQLIRARTAGGHIPTLTLAVLRELPIPLLPADVIANLRELQESEQQLRAEADKLEAMRAGVFSGESIADVRETLRRIKQASSSVTQSVEKAEDFDFQVRNLYPFPVAFGYRQLTSLIETEELYREQLRVAENLLAFLGSVSLAMATWEQCDVGADLKGAWRGGISPGHWRDIAVAASRALANKELPLGRALDSLWTSRKRPRFDSAIEGLIAAKNDYKHDRGPAPGTDMRDKGGELRTALLEALKKIGFIIDYTLQYVVDQDAVRNSSRVIVRSLVLRGDHPAWAQDSRELPRLLKKHDVYIAISADEWVDLYPFITIQTCSMCKVRETYFIDRCDFDRKKATLKSFERGHTKDSPEIGEALFAIVDLHRQTQQSQSTGLQEQER
jgi:hypothetical protein